METEARSPGSRGSSQRAPKVSQTLQVAHRFAGCLPAPKSRSKSKTRWGGGQRAGRTCTAWHDIVIAHNPVLSGKGGKPGRKSFPQYHPSIRKQFRIFKEKNLKEIHRCSFLPKTCTENTLLHTASPSALLRKNWHTSLCDLTVYSMVVWFTDTV